MVERSTRPGFYKAVKPEGGNEMAFANVIYLSQREFEKFWS